MKWRNFFLVSFFCAMVAVRGQDCPLGLGGTDPQQIAKVFEFDTAQEQRMLNWVDSLEQKNAPLQLELDELLASHPQQTPSATDRYGAEVRGDQRKDGSEFTIL